MGVPVPETVGVGVRVGVIEPVACVAGVGVTFFVGVGVFAATLGDGVGVEVGVGVWIVVGVTKIILIASSSWTGERIFLLDTKTPTIMATSTKKPIITVMAASVLRRSSIRHKYSTPEAYSGTTRLDIEHET